MSSRVNQKEAARVVREELAKEKARTRRLYVSIGVVVVLILAGLGGWAVYSSQRTDTSNVAVPAHANSDKSGLVVGSGSATIDVYLDFMCPICGDFEKTSGDAINKLVDDEKAKIVYHPVSFLDRASNGTEYSTRSSAAAGCASDAGKLREYVKVMYANQPSEGSDGLTNSQIIAFAAASGITGDTFTKCVNDQKYAPWTAQVTEAATNNKVNGTPTVLVNGKQVNATADAITKAVG
jgi:protein-disulfide isomerase